jgi:predicted oxidoreductase
MNTDADVIVVGAGLAGLVATRELTARGKRVAVIDQENANNLGGQAFWSFGGLFLVNSPEQRRLGVKDSVELAWNDWQGSAAFDRLDGVNPADEWAIKWARGYVEFAAGAKRAWLRRNGITLLPTVGWAERGDGRANGHGNSVPRFHVPWGTGTGVVGPFVRYAQQAEADGLVRFYHRHSVDELIIDGGVVTGVRGTILAEDSSARGVTSNRDKTGEFTLTGQAVIVTSGGIGGNHDIVRRYWPQQLGTPPANMITGVPAHVDGRMLDIAAGAGVRVVNRDRMWHYTEGVQNWNPIWPGHGIRILPGPSSMWFDALGRRLPGLCLPGYDTLSTLRYLRTTADIAAYDHSWFILTQKIIEKEFALSGSEQNPDITDGDKKAFFRDRLLSKGAPEPVAAFKSKGADFVVADTLTELIDGMNKLTDAPLLDVDVVRAQIQARDLQIDNNYTKDVQVMAIRNARKFIGERLGRTAAPHKILDPAHGPLIGVKLHIVTRKTLGGIQTNLQSQALDEHGSPIQGLYAAGEVAGFGGGGVHGYNSLEGTFLGGCIFSGLAAGRHAANSI